MHVTCPAARGHDTHRGHGPNTIPELALLRGRPPLCLCAWLASGRIVSFLIISVTCRLLLRVALPGHPPRPSLLIHQVLVRGFLPTPLPCCAPVCTPALVLPSETGCLHLCWTITTKSHASQQGAGGCTCRAVSSLQDSTSLGYRSLLCSEIH